jgi:membrane protease YdiL (CAAX protease family)
MIAATLLAAILIFALPARAIFHSLGTKPKRSRSRRYAETMAEILTLLVGLWAVAFLERISLSDLGMAWPPSDAGLAGFAVAAMLILGFLTMVLLAKPKPTTPLELEAMADMPQSKGEAWLFGALAPVLGFGWEALYRAYLLWYLTPLVGLIPAIVIASVAYGLAHGLKSRFQVIGSLVSAFLFTIGFAVTKSLWWLVAIHIAAPLIGMAAARRRRITTEASVGEAVPI